jgi:hypothetical protein
MSTPASSQHSCGADVNSDYAGHEPEESYPPAGIFAWHYAQCVLRRFGAQQFFDLTNAQYEEVPSRFRRDAEEDSENEDEVAPPPATFLPIAMHQYLANQQLRKEVTEWRDQVPSGAIA